MPPSKAKIGQAAQRGADPQLISDDLRGRHSPAVMRPTEELDESSVVQLRTLFELLDRWEREVCGPHEVTVGSQKQ